MMMKCDTPGCGNTFKGNDTCPPYCEKCLAEVGRQTMSNPATNQQQPPTPNSGSTTPITEHTGSKYLRAICPADGNGQPIKVDVYEVLRAFNVNCPARQHAVKKLLCAGLRGKGSQVDDLQGAVEATWRALEIQKQDEVSNHPTHDNLDKDHDGTESPRRTRSEVVAARKTMSGCCDRHVDRMACDCLSEAIDDTQVKVGEVNYVCGKCKTRQSTRGGILCDECRDELESYNE